MRDRLMGGMGAMRVVVLFLGIVVLGVATLAAAGCAALTPATDGPSPSGLPVIRYVNFKVYDPVYVALERGFFEQRGVRVEIVGDVLGGPTAIQAVASGSVQAGLSSLPALINATTSGLPVVGVSDIQSAIGDQPLEEYFVRADSDIQTIGDLRGRAVAVNLWRSSFHYTLLMALEQAGVPEAEVEFRLLSFDHQIPALEQGQVDVIGLMEPYASMARTHYQDQFRRLFTALDVFGEKQFTTHFVNRDWAEQHPESVRAFVGGVVEAIAWIEANPDAARPIIARYTGIEERYIPAYHFQPDGRVVMEDVRFWLDYMVQRGDVEASALTPEHIATNRFNAAVTGDE
ncbi:MAG: ABC transporter substrate-binding protein [Chloroflexaceae bacterium]|nr:ABC transporter substrate-binding protein [Chloroflexaceae bacterium]